MTATSPPQSEPDAPAVPERPRLLVNGEPMRPEDLGQCLSPSVLQRLHSPKVPDPPTTETLELPPVEPPGSARPSRPARSWGTLLWGVVLGLGLVVALYLLLR